MSKNGDGGCCGCLVVIGVFIILCLAVKNCNQNHEYRMKQLELRELELQKTEQNENI